MAAILIRLAPTWRATTATGTALPACMAALHTTPSLAASNRGGYRRGERRKAREANDGNDARSTAPRDGNSRHAHSNRSQGHGHGHGRSHRRREDGASVLSGSSSSSMPTAAPSRDLEEEWRGLRSRAVPIPREHDPLDAPVKRALQERMRKRRLGLLPEEEEDADDDAFAQEYRQHLQKQSQRREWVDKRDAFQRKQQHQTKGGGRSASGTSMVPRGRYKHRPTTEQDKIFTRLQAAPDSVMEREYLEPDEPENPRGLDIAVIGRPNAGKSSIVNRLLNATISAVSPKYNTTRDRVMGILTEKDTQLTFYDTPGLIKPKESHQYVSELVTTAAETVESVDMSMLVVDSVKRLDQDAMEALEKFITSSAQVASPLMLVMNKFDLVTTRDEANLEHKIDDISQMIEDLYEKHYEAGESEMEGSPLRFIGRNALKVSALRGNSMDQLKSTLQSLAVDRPWSYHSSMKSDQSDLDLVAEIIREKLFRRFNKELPYAIQQENVGWTRFKDHSIRIDQDIFVPAARVRKMVIGKNGDTIRSVGVAAREEIQALLSTPVHLYLNVRVR